MFRPFSQLAKRRLQQKTWLRNELHRSKAKTDWQRALEQYFPNTKDYSVQLKGDVLTIATHNSILAAEMRLREQVIKDTINTQLERHVVKRVIYLTK